MGLLNEKEVAERLKISCSSLRKWRFSNRGPKYIKYGRAVRYRIEDLEEFLADSVVTPGGANAPGSAAA